MSGRKKNSNTASPSKTRSVLKILLIVVVVIGVLASGSIVVLQYYYGKLNTMPIENKQDVIIQPIVGSSSDVKIEKAELTADAKLEIDLESKSDVAYSSKNVKNILLVGADNDYSEGMDSVGNADGILLVSINSETKQVVLTSFMRDIYVREFGGYNTKLTTTYHNGGIRSLLNTMEANFDIQIDNYLLFNYLDIIKIIDAVGGVEVDLYDEEIRHANGKIGNLNTLTGQPKGSNMLSNDDIGLTTVSGIQAAAYMRVRMAGNNDFERTERIREVLLSLKDKVKNMSLFELNDMADVVLSSISTDMTSSRFLSLLVNSPKYFKYEIQSNRIPIEGSYSLEDCGGAVAVIDYALNNAYLHSTIYDGVTPKNTN